MNSQLLRLSQKASRFFLKDFRTVGWFYLIVLLVASALQYFIRSRVGEGVSVFRYNNYIIFRQAFFHLLEGKDMYIFYPDEQWDLFKYSPTFALLMGPMAVLPDLPGLILWNSLNAGLLFYSVKGLPFKEDRVKIIILWFIFQELLTSIQNSQSNALMAALLILAFTSFERKNLLLAALFIVLGMYIKIFALVGAALSLLYPRKWAFIGYSAMWFTLLLLLPLLVTAPDQLITQYRGWWQMLSTDHSVSDGLSVMGWLKAWFGIGWSKNLIVLAGILLFCLPYFRIQLYRDLTFRLLFLSSILIWMVIFNHKAESPTFIIAVCGVAIWYFSQKKNNLGTILVVLAFVFTSLSPTDIFPPYVRHHFVEPYVLKAVFCIFIWFRIVYELISNKYLPAVTPNESI